MLRRDNRVLVKCVTSILADHYHHLLQHTHAHTFPRTLTISASNSSNCEVKSLNKNSDGTMFESIPCRKLLARDSNIAKKKKKKSGRPG